MSPALAIDLVRQSVMLALLLAAPLLATALLVGVLVSLLQAVTQIQEQTLTFVPKLLALAVVFALTLPWVLGRLIEFLSALLRGLPTMVAG
jgi:flagellar biosynthetic protein FliQ